MEISTEQFEGFYADQKFTIVLNGGVKIGVSTMVAAQILKAIEMGKVIYFMAGSDPANPTADLAVIILANVSCVLLEKP